MGRRFCNLDQISVEIMQFGPRNRMKNKNKKGLHRKLKCFFPKSREDRKKGLHRNLGLYSARIYKIYSCWPALFRLIISAQISMGGRLDLDGGR